MSEEALPEFRPLQLLDLAKQVSVKPVDLPELGGRVYVRKLSSATIDTWESMTRKSRAWLVIQGVCDAQGEPMFNQSHANDINAGRNEVWGRLAFEVATWNSMGEQAKEDVKKNSETDPSADSG